MDRRAFLTTGAAATALGLLSSCGSPESQETPPPEPSAPGFPVTLRHKLGVTTVPAPPRRIVALGAADGDAALALGMPLAAVGIPPILGNISPWTAPHLGTTPTLTMTDGPPLEQVAALRPDLILAAGMERLDPSTYRQLSDIAPTTGYQTGLYRDGWDQITNQVGTAVGRPDAAHHIVDDLHGRLDQLHAQHPQWAGRTFSIANVTESGSVGVLRATSDSGVQLMNQLGFRLAPTVANLPGHRYAARVSTERLDVLDADVFIAHYASFAARQAFESAPEFAQLNAVQRDAYIALDTPPFIAVRMPSPLSLPYGLDPLIPALEHAVPA